jgi:hypothetical protein
VLDLVTTHARVLAAVAADPRVLARDVARHIGVSERMVWFALSDLRAAGYLSTVRTRRGNRYTVDLDRPLHPHAGRTVGDLLAVLRDPPGLDLAGHVGEDGGVLGHAG